MSLRTSLERARERKPRVIVLVERRTAGQPPLGQQHVSAPELARRIAPVLPFLAEGRVPLDSQQAEHAGHALERIWTEAQKEPNRG